MYISVNNTAGKVEIYLCDRYCLIDSQQVNQVLKKNINVEIISIYILHV